MIKKILSNKNGFTLIELIVVVGLVAFVLLGVSQILTFSLKTNRNAEQRLDRTLSNIAFQQVAGDILDSLSISVEYLHLPIPVACDSATSPFCVRKLDLQTGVYSSPVTLNGVSGSVSKIEFFKDYYSISSDAKLTEVGLYGPSSTEKYLEMQGKPESFIGLQDNLYATWVLSGVNSTPFVALRKSNLSYTFIIDRDFVTTDLNKLNNSQNIILVKPIPAVTDANVLSQYVGRLVVVFDPNNNHQFFVQKIVAIGFCGGDGQGHNIPPECKDAWLAYKNQNQYPNLPVQTGDGNMSNELVFLKLVALSQSPSGFSPAIQGVQDYSNDQSSINVYLFPTLISNFFVDDSATQTRLLEFKTDSSQQNQYLTQKVAAYTNTQLLIKPIELTKFYLQSSSTQNVYRLFMEDYRSDGNNQKSVILDGIKGFVLFSRKIGTNSFSIFSSDNSINNVFIYTNAGGGGGGNE
jgi:prepilin-type N-terminal cleavage/methylation domain-containing protein